MNFSNRQYNALKWSVAVFLPALTTFVGAIGEIYQWPQTDALTQTLTALTTFAGSVLMLSAHHYHKKGEDTHDPNR